MAKGYVKLEFVQSEEEPKVNLLAEIKLEDYNGLDKMLLMNALARSLDMSDMELFLFYMMNKTIDEGSTETRVDMGLLRGLANE